MPVIERAWLAEQNRYFLPEGLPKEAVEAADRYVLAAQQSRDRSLLGLKITLGANLFLWHLDAFESPKDPVPGFVSVFSEAAEVLERAEKAAWFGRHFSGPAGSDTARAVGDIYGDAWQLLDANGYFNGTFSRFNERFRRNGIDPRDIFAGKVVLDIGCGCGNYSAALAQCEAERVIAMDVGEAGLEFGNKMIANSKYRDRIEFRLGSATAIPLPAGSVDAVWSNSVVHVCGDYVAALAEAVRVLKPGGTFFLYVDGQFGLFELLVNSLLCAFTGVPQSLFQHAMAAAGSDPGRIGWMVANCYVPYERRPQIEVESLLAQMGIAEVRQMRRGIDIDQIEFVSQGLPYAALKYGEAQLKFLCRKN